MPLTCTPLTKLRVLSATFVRSSHRVARRIGRTNARFYYLLLLHRPPCHSVVHSYREMAYFFSPASETMQAVGKTMAIAGDYRSHALVKLTRTRAWHYITFLVTKMICCPLVKRKNDSRICRWTILSRTFSPISLRSPLRSSVITPGLLELTTRLSNGFTGSAEAFAKNITNMIRDESRWIVMHHLTDISLICFHGWLVTYPRPGLADRELA